MLAAGAGLFAAAVAHGGDTATAVRNGGTFKIALVRGFSSGSLDPGVLDDAPDPALLALLDATCARLMAYPDERPPAGYRLRPEVAVRPPGVSRDGKTYTFVLRRSFRFSNRSRVGASAFAWSITRTLKLKAGFPSIVDDIVGAEQLKQGRAKRVAGIVARGNRLVIRLLRPAPTFPARLTNFCAVAPTLPADPEGALTFPAAGPYYVAEHVRGRRIVLRQNRFYGGSRPRHVARFFAEGNAPSVADVVDRVQRGSADWGWAPPRFYFERQLAARYGVNRSQFWIRPGLTLIHYPLNTRRQLFRNNPALRRAVNFAVNRSALRRQLVRESQASRLTDQYLPPGFPGFKDARIYPLRRPNVARARALARGHRRSGKAVLYTPASTSLIAAAQVVKRNLASIGLEVEVTPISGDYIGRLLGNPDEPWDIAFAGWSQDHLDPFSYLNELFDGQFIGVSNLSGFDVARYNRGLRRAARLKGGARYRAYAALDVRLARDAAPTVAIQYVNEVTFVSRRVDPRCVVLRPALVLNAVCLK
jgi:ABC-type transport system substrate-binding protein